MNTIIEQRIRDSIEVKKRILSDDAVMGNLSKLADTIVMAIQRGNKIIVCGNGGSASDALHFAGEMLGRFQKERSAWPVIVLNADVATMTAIANDYSYDDIFARQVQGYVDKEDIFIGISTSGNSENVFRAVKAAKGKRAVTAALLGKDGGRIGREVECPIIVPAMVTARIQESHIMLIHIICEIVEEKLGEN